jgi:hypothetical protein
MFTYVSGERAASMFRAKSKQQEIGILPQNFSVGTEENHDIRFSG